MNVLYSLQHLGYVIPPQADAGWIGEAGPGPDLPRPGLGRPRERLHQPQHDVHDLEPAAPGADAQGRRRHPGPRQPALGVGRRLPLRLPQPRVPLTHTIRGDDRPEGPVHRRHGASSAPRARSAPSTSASTSTCSTAGSTSIRPLPAEAHGPARRHPRPGRPRARRSASASSTPSSTSSPSRPSTCRPTSTCSRGRTGQYVFISSASAYQTPPARLPVIESTPLRNPFWQYSRDKIACEDLLVARLPRGRLPGDDRAALAHLRPRRACPFDGGWTVVDRMRQGKQVVVHGDGTSLWTLTHHDDFARGLRRPARPPPGDRRRLPHHLRRGADLEPDLRARSAAAAGVAAAPRARRRPTRSPPPTRDWGAGLLGDKAHSMVFDNAKVRGAGARLRARRSRSRRARARSSPGTTRTPRRPAVRA